MGTMINSAETVLQPGSEKTSKTDKTYSIGNRDFLQTVFGGNLTETRPVVVSFKGNPRTVPRRFWFGRPWQGSHDLTIDLPVDANNYFSLAVFGRAPAMVRDAVKQATLFQEEHRELGEVLWDIADESGEINCRKLGWWMKRHAGRIVDGRRFVRASGNRSAEAWKVEVVGSVLPVSSVSNPQDRKSVSDASVR